MNDDNFEQRLRRQPLRKIPDEWRPELLAAAQPTVRPRPSTHGSLQTGWLSTLLWPCPQAWAGLAAVWLVILAINLSMADRPAIAVKKAPSRAPEIIMAFREQKRLLAELIGPSETSVADRPKSFAPKPRSERRDETLAA